MSESNPPAQFAHLFQQTQEQVREKQQGSFEARVVEKILQHVGLPVAEERRRAGGAFSIAWFRDRFPEFPVVMMCEKIAGTAGTRVGYTDLFGKSFGKLPWVKAYQTALALEGVSLLEKLACFVFNAPHTSGGTLLCIHNCADSADMLVAKSDETRIIRTYGPEKITFITESLTSFLQRVGTQWITG